MTWKICYNTLQTKMEKIKNSILNITALKKTKTRKRQVYKKVMIAFCKDRKGPSIKNSEKWHHLYIPQKERKKSEHCEVQVMCTILKPHFTSPYLLPPWAFKYGLYWVCSPNCWWEVVTSIKRDTFWTMNKYTKQKLSTDYSFLLNVRINRIGEKK